MKRLGMFCLLSPLLVVSLHGQYSHGYFDSENAFDAPIPGFIGPDGDGAVIYKPDSGSPNGESPDLAYLNPIFLNWADSVESYSPTSTVADDWQFKANAVGSAIGEQQVVVSLGDLLPEEIDNGVNPGEIVLAFNERIYNAPGADFAVFENGYITTDDQGGFGVGGIWAELAYVEVSTDGENFARFPSVSLTEDIVSPYGSIDPTLVFNLAGKHVNADGESWGTPFDLSQLLVDPLVISGAVDLDNIFYIRIIDIPGRGDFLDSLGNPIYDAWYTFGSGGADIDGIGVVSNALSYDEWDAERNLVPGDNDDGDLWPNLVEYAFGYDPELHESEEAVRLEVLEDRLVYCFPREMRTSDCRILVETSLDLDNWETVATLGPLNEISLTESVLGIGSTSRHTQASLGVLRDFRLDFALPETQVFFRLTVEPIE
ncbi:hypothetical protein [Cerasicoccus arenae]|nr:hypothetical protein [Cerasicoccus arenae]